MAKRITKLINGVFLALGLAMLAVMFVKMDLSEVTDHLIKTKWHFLFALLAYFAAVFGSTTAWWFITDPAASRAQYRHFLAALWAGHALNTVTPTSSLGEVFKGSLMRDKVQGKELVASLITFNFLATIVTQAFTMLGPLVCLVLLDLPQKLVLALFGVAFLFFIPVVAMYLALRFGVAKRVIHLVRKLPLVRLRDPQAWLDKAHSIDRRIKEFPRSRPKAFTNSLIALSFVRVMQVIEVWILLLPLLPDKGAFWILLLSMIVQTASQLIAWIMTFVPSQIGVAEGGSTLLFQMVGLDPIVGFSMELARRIRKLIGITIGLLIGWWLLRVQRRKQNQTHPSHG